MWGTRAYGSSINCDSVIDFLNVFIEGSKKNGNYYNFRDEVVERLKGM